MTSLPIDRDLLLEGKRLGYSDEQLAHLIGYKAHQIRKSRIEHGIRPTYKTVDTCAAEFEAETPYFYSTYETENESRPSDKQKIVILGGGPNRIGQGIEFDYCCVQSVFALQDEGHEAIMINCNPETVSTDFDVADKLYFEPLTFEDVMNVLELEQPDGVLIQFGGQTPLSISRRLGEAGAPILGTSPEQIDLAENREKFGAILTELDLPHPEDGSARTVDEAIQIANRIGYPVLVRPSYVLGGRSMSIVYDPDDLVHYVRRSAEVSPEHPILIDQFLEDAFEFDVDAVCDGTEVFIGGVMQHIEEAGIHSGDSSCVIPPYLISSECLATIEETTRRLALRLGVIGLLNIQFAIKNEVVYVLEVNPRASRTIPFVSKAVGVPLAQIATRVCLGHRLSDLGLTGKAETRYISVKKPVFPFSRFPGTRLFLGPEMKSTGEVMGISLRLGNAYSKAMEGGFLHLPTSGTVFLSVNENDKVSVIDLARDFQELGFDILATRGTARALIQNGIPATFTYKVHEGRPDVVDLMKNGAIDLIINTPLGKKARYDEDAIGQTALLLGIPMITTLSGTAAAIRGIRNSQQQSPQVRTLQEYHQLLQVDPS